MMDNSLNEFRLVKITEEEAQKCTNHHMGCDCREFALNQYITHAYERGFKAGLLAQKNRPNQEEVLIGYYRPAH